MPSPVSDIQRWRSRERSELPDCRADSPRVALVYPNTYAVGMSSLGYQTTLFQMRSHGLDAQRYFSLAEPISIEESMPIRQADVIAFSIAWELDWLHVLQFLDRARLPIRADERGPGHPLVFAGGVCAMMNRAPAWPFVDFFLHGEAEVIMPGLAKVLLRRDLSRSEIVEAIAHLPGLEITSECARAYGLDEWSSASSLIDPPEPIILADLDSHPCMTRVFSPEAEFADMGLICIARGCPNRCTFCWIGHNAPEHRTVSYERVMEWAQWQLRFTDRIGLVASAVGAHPRIDDICRDLIAQGAKLSYSSLRAEEVTPAMLDALAASRQKSITLAPEVGSPRLRRLLGKNIPDEKFFEVIDAALERGMSAIKLYFMTGLPTETDDEAMQIVEFVEKTRERILAHTLPSGRTGSISVNLGLFVPKPNLPLLRVPDALTWREKGLRLKAIVKQIARIPNTRVMSSSAELAHAQSILSIDREHSSAFLEEVFKAQGNWRSIVRHIE